MRPLPRLLFLLSALVTLCAPQAVLAKDIQRAILAGGCFWCVEKDFDQVRGVVKTTSGYIGGKTKNPTYKRVSKGNTGHYEAVEVVFDADVVSFEQILYVFWRTVDPTDAGGQFCDRGDSYRTAIFTTSGSQTKIAKASKAQVDASGALPKKVVTPILRAAEFYPAETYHQNYYKKNPSKYKFYRWNCGRDKRVKKLWGKQAINS